MRDEPNGRIERHRVRSPESLACAGSNTGAFLIPFGGAYLFVIASDGMGWEHVSVSVRGQERCPTWEEMCHIKGLWWTGDECVVQFHPPKYEYVNNHNYCLHLWREIGVNVKTPPSILVGYKTTEAA